jgi:hypothetical protein
MDNTALFNNERFSDLKIKLSDCKLLSVHKVVVCRRIEYFDHLCGPNSRFAVSIMPDPGSSSASIRSSSAGTTQRSSTASATLISRSG